MNESKEAEDAQEKDYDVLPGTDLNMTILCSSDYHAKTQNQFSDWIQGWDYVKSG